MINVVLRDGKLCEVFNEVHYEIKCPVFEDITYMDYHHDKPSIVKIPIRKYGATLKALFWKSSEESSYYLYYKKGDMLKTIQERTHDYFTNYTQYKALERCTKTELCYIGFTNHIHMKVNYGATLIDDEYEDVVLTADNVIINVVAIY